VTILREIISVTFSNAISSHRWSRIVFEVTGILSANSQYTHGTVVD